MSAVAGIAFSFLKKDQERNTISFLGLKIEVSTTASLLIVLGCLTFAAPAVMAYLNKKEAEPSRPVVLLLPAGTVGNYVEAGSRSEPKTEPRKLPKPANQTVRPAPPRCSSEKSIRKICPIASDQQVACVAFGRIKDGELASLPPNLAAAEGQHVFFGHILTSEPLGLGIGFGYDNGSGLQARSLAYQGRENLSCAQFEFNTSVGSVYKARPVAQISDWKQGDKASAAVEIWEVK